MKRVMYGNSFFDPMAELENDGMKTPPPASPRKKTKIEETPENIGDLSRFLGSSRAPIFTPEKEDMLKRAIKEIEDPDLVSPKRIELGKRLTLILSDKISEIEDPSRSFIPAVAMPFFQAATPKGRSSSSLSTLGGFPVLDGKHITSPEEGCHWKPSSDIEFVEGPIFHPITGVFVGTFQSPDSGRKKYSSFFPDNLCATLDDLKQYLLAGVIRAQSSNRWLMSNGNLFYEMYMRNGGVVIRSAFPIFHFFVLEDQKDTYEMPINGKILTSVEIQASICKSIKNFMTTIGWDLKSPLRFMTEQKDYIFDLAVDEKILPEIKMGIYVQIAEANLLNILQEIEGYDAQDIIDDLTGQLEV